MSRLVSYFLIAIFLNTWAGDDRVPFGEAVHAFDQAEGRTPQDKGDWVARKADGRETGRDSRAAIRMRLFDRQGRVRERALSTLTLKGGPGRPVPGDRSLTRFTYPNDISGTGFLVWEDPAGEDERFLYLPSLGRVRRIAGNETQDSFVGSDFTYEDIGGREFADYTYMLLDESSSWTAPDGNAHAAYRLESRAKSANARFPRVVSLVRKDNFVVVRAEIHNKRDELQKTFDVRKLDRVGGIWTVLEMVMTDAMQRTRTELTIDKIEYNVGLKEADFSRRELERGAGR